MLFFWTHFCKDNRMRFGAFVLLVLFNVFPGFANAYPEQDWISRRKPLVPTSVRWDAHYSGVTEADRQAILDELESSLTRMLAHAPRSHLFRGPHQSMQGKAIDIELAYESSPDSIPDAQIDFKRGPDHIWHLTVRISVNRLTGEKTPDEVAARTDITMAQIFLAIIPQFLATHATWLESLENGGDSRLFLEYIRQRHIQAVTRILTDLTTPKPNAAQVRAFHRVLHDLRIQALAAREDIPATTHFVGQSEGGLKLTVPWPISEALGVELGTIANRAIAIVQSFPPRHRTNSPFSWDPADWAWTRNVRVELEIGQSDNPSTAMLWEKMREHADQMRATPLSPFFVGTSHSFALNRVPPIPGGVNHRVIGLVPFEPALGEEKERWKHDSLARLVAAMGGQIYGPMTKNLEAAAKGEHEATFDFERILNDVASSHGQAIELLERILLDAVFLESLSAKENEDFRRVLAEYRNWWKARFGSDYQTGMNCVIAISQSPNAPGPEKN